MTTAILVCIFGISLNNPTGTAKTIDLSEVELTENNLANTLEVFNLCDSLIGGYATEAWIVSDKPIDGADYAGERLDPESNQSACDGDL